MYITLVIYQIYTSYSSNRNLYFYFKIGYLLVGKIITVAETQLIQYEQHKRICILAILQKNAIIKQFSYNSNYINFIVITIATSIIKVLSV